MNKIHFESTVLPHIGKTAKFAGFCFNDTFHKNSIDLSKDQWLILKKLHDSDGLVQNELAFITERSKTALTRMITTIEKKGYVNRVHSKSDKRLNYIFLTDEGKSVFKKSLPVLKNLVKNLQMGIDQEDLIKTIEVLNKIQKNISKLHNNHNK